MLSLRLQNIRSLQDTGFMQLKPLTVLVGKNNSGKSTFTRFFPLLRQSVQGRSNSPILWFGELVDFGSVKEVKSHFSGRDKIRFEIAIDAESLGPYFRVLFATRRTTLTEFKRVSFGLELSEIENTTHVCSIHASVDDDKLEISINDDGDIAGVRVNADDYSNLFSAKELQIENRHIVPTFQILANIVGRDEKDWVPVRGQGFESVRKAIQQIYRNRLHGRFSPETLSNIAAAARYVPGNRFLDLLRSRNSEYETWGSFVEYLSTDRGASVLRNLRNLYFLRDLPEFFNNLDRTLTLIFSNVGYIGPTRATGERYYRIQELAVDQIDPRGENLAIFLNSMKSWDQKDFQNWTGKYLGYEVRTERQPGHISVMVKERDSAEEFNLADVGYGLSQILPVMAQVWAQTRFSNYRTPLNILTVEQPELHLHPAYQARIADALVGALSEQGSIEYGGRPTCIVVETHSQPLINRIGQLISEKKFNAADVAIYVFDKPPEEIMTRVSHATFDDAGDLRNWPFGFFSSRSPT